MAPGEAEADSLEEATMPATAADLTLTEAIMAREKKDLEHSQTTLLRMTKLIT